MKQKHIDMCQHINLSTQPADIMQTMLLEIPVVRYHFYKNFGGRNKYLKHEDELTDRALAEKCDQVTEISEHISHKGNRWLSYTHAEYFPKALYTQAWVHSFIYYETYASCGAFFPMYRPRKSQGKAKKNAGNTNDEIYGVIIYTDHFFLRMADRTGKPYRSRELIREFITTKQTHAVQADEDGEVIIKFKDGYGFGKQLSDNPVTLEIRTFLTDRQLSAKQRRKCERVDALAEFNKDGMFLKNVAAHTAYHRDWNDEDAALDGQKKLDAARKLGLERPMVLMSAVHLCFVHALEELLPGAKVTMQQSAVIAAETGGNALPLVQKWAFVDGKTMTQQQERDFKEDLLDVMVRNARQLKLKSLTRERIEGCLDRIVADSVQRAEDFNNEPKA